MRKIMLTTSYEEISPNEREQFQILLQKRDDGSVQTLYKEQRKWMCNQTKKYTVEEQEKIDIANNILVGLESATLTEEEIAFMLDPAGMHKRTNELVKEMEDPAVLQRMAGFKVEKVITPLD
jgi:hypothetical protein